MSDKPQLNEKALDGLAGVLDDLNRAILAARLLDYVGDPSLDWAGKAIVAKIHTEGACNVLDLIYWGEGVFAGGVNKFARSLAGQSAGDAGEAFLLLDSLDVFNEDREGTRDLTGKALLALQRSRDAVDGLFRACMERGQG